MRESLLELTLAYVALSALLIAILLHSSHRNWLKALLLVGAPVIYWLSYQGWRETQGWPSLTHLPDRFLLHYAVIEEPDGSAGLEGALFLWLTDLDNNEIGEVPRAYELPYDRGVHRKLDAALQEIQNGNIQLGEIHRGSQNLQKTDESTSQTGELYEGLEFARLPDPALPEK